MTTTYVKVREQVRNIDIETLEPAAEISLTVSGGATPSNTSDVIDVRGARLITLQLDHYRGVAGNASLSVDLDIIIYTKEGASWDMTAYSTTNLTTPTIKTVAITPGVGYIKVFINNKDAVHTTKILPTLCVIYGY